MCFSFNRCLCNHVRSNENFEHEVEQTEDGLTIKIKAKSPEKAEALKKMFEAHKELCGENRV
jgi:hypothetical protein